MGGWLGGSVRQWVGYLGDWIDESVGRWVGGRLDKWVIWSVDESAGRCVSQYVCR